MRAFMNDEFVGSYLEVAQFSFVNIPSKAQKSKQKKIIFKKSEFRRLGFHFFVKMSQFNSRKEYVYFL